MPLGIFMCIWTSNKHVKFHIKIPSKWQTTATILCGHLIGPIMRLACPSVDLSVCPAWARYSKTKKRRKIKIGIIVPKGTSKWSANFQMKRSKVKVTGRQKPQKVGVMFTYGRRIRCRRLRHRLQTRPTTLLGLSYCLNMRCSATGRTAACHVGIRRRHSFLLLLTVI